MTTDLKPNQPLGVTRLAGAPSGGAHGPRLTLRVDFGQLGALGPGKVRLLELVDDTGSIAAAGRAMGMSYRRAWLLIDAVNRAFRQPLVETRHGGKGGGATSLSPLGHDIVRRYRAMEARAAATLGEDLDALRAALSDHGPASFARLDD